MRTRNNKLPLENEPDGSQARSASKDEVRSKTEELDLSNIDLQNLVESSEVPILFLDHQFRIRKFTRAIQKVAALQDKHIGLPLSSVAPELASPQLAAAATEAVRSLQAQDEQLWVERSQAWFIVRSMPYRALDQTVLGPVLTFTDITEIKGAQEQRAQFAGILDSSADAIIGMSLETVVRAWNKGAERMYGWTAEEIIGHPLGLIVPPDRLEEIQSIVARLSRGEEVAPFETTFLTKSLQHIDVLITFSHAREPGGTLTGISLIARDISENKRAQATARLLAAIVESSDDAIVSKDLNGIITSWNKGAAQLFGYTEEEIIGKPVTTFIPLGLHSEEATILNRIRHGQKIEHYETTRQRKDGSLIQVSLTVSPVRDNQGRITGASKIARDITEQKRIEGLLAAATARLAKSNEDLELRVQERTAELSSSNSQLEALVYSIAHDLRAPLRAMQSFSTILLEDYSAKLEEEGQDYARRIMQSAESMDRLILDLLAYGRLGHEKMVLSTVDLEKCWASARAQNEELIIGQAATVEVMPPLLAVRAHPGALTQILANLLNNALRFVPPSRSPHVRLRTEKRSPMVRIWIEDNGIGIDQKHHDRIFHVFQQLHGKKFGGTGVGLAIVRRAAERMGGYVGLESQLGHGTRFWLELPPG